jgi:hypothetical protein
LSNLQLQLKKQLPLPGLAIASANMRESSRIPDLIVENWLEP